VKQRDLVAMTAEEVAVFLLAGRKVQLATNGQGGFPHLVTMYYVMKGGQITFWTYRSSQKARNLERDPRISCLVESGQEYYDLRGVLVQGLARRIEDPARVAEIGRLITGVLTGGGAAGPGPLADAGQLDEYVARAARKRIAFTVQPDRIISWDHAKLTPN